MSKQWQFNLAFNTDARTLVSPFEKCLLYMQWFSFIMHRPFRLVLFHIFLTVKRIFVHFWGFVTSMYSPILAGQSVEKSRCVFFFQQILICCYVELLLLLYLEFRWFDLCLSRLKCKFYLQFFFILIFSDISGTLDANHINQTHTNFVSCRFFYIHHIVVLNVNAIIWYDHQYDTNIHIRELMPRCQVTCMKDFPETHKSGYNVNLSTL